MSRTTRIIGHMVTHNELGRYLRASLAWLTTLCDEVVVFDDQSTDGTYEYLTGTDALVGRRHPAELGFESDESVFRQTAWRYMETRVKPVFPDWILCIDADEFLVPTDATADARCALTDLVQQATSIDAQAVAFQVAEVFHRDGNDLSVRTDGYWGDIRACRLVQWRPSAVFHPRREGGGSVPSSWISWRFTSEEMRLLHLGYATPEDRKARFMRYSAGRGHNPRHIASIRERPTTVPWDGPIPDGLQ